MNTTEWACFGPQVPECRPVTSRATASPSAVNDGPGWVESGMDCRGEVDPERRLDAAWDEWAELRRDFPP